LDDLFGEKTFIQSFNILGFKSIVISDINKKKNIILLLGRSCPHKPDNTITQIVATT
jgi:hypothetical protein